MTRFVLPAALLALALAPLVARADPAGLYGALPRGVATAGTLTGAADDASAAYYNPAGLSLGAESGQVQVQLGYGAGVPLLGVERDKAGSSVETKVPAGQGWLEAAALLPLKGKLEPWKPALGLMVFHPQDKLLRVESLDPKYPQFLRYQAAPDRLVISAGLGFQLGKFVAVGLGVQVLAALAGEVNFDVDLFDRKVDKRDISMSMRTTPSPTAGLIVRPTEQLRIGLSARGEQGLLLSLPSVIGLGDVGTLELLVSGTMHYTPAQVALGAQYALSEELKLSADLKLDFWGWAPSPALDVQVRLSGEIPEGLGLDKALSFGANNGPTGFIHVLTPSLAGEWRMPDKVSLLRFGYAYRPTFVPDQTEATNWLDNTAHVLGFGGSFQFMDPSGVFSRPLKLELAGQGQAMQPRRVEKKLRDPAGVGTYSFGGVALAFSATVRYDF
jgi:long-subunit fatty acid transport protein